MFLSAFLLGLNRFLVFFFFDAAEVARDPGSAWHLREKGAREVTDCNLQVGVLGGSPCIPY